MVPSPLAAPQPSAPGAPPAPSPAASNSALDPAFPMLGTITEQTSQRLMMERRYDLDHDLFLRDHTLGNAPSASDPRSEEHTSELQSLMRIPYAVFCLKKKKITTTN